MYFLCSRVYGHLWLTLVRTASGSFLCAVLHSQPGSSQWNDTGCVEAVAVRLRVKDIRSGHLATLPQTMYGLTIRSVVPLLKPSTSQAFGSTDPAASPPIGL